jgi:hypothetical protein
VGREAFATRSRKRAEKSNYIGEPLLFICQIRYNEGMKAIPREVERTRSITWSREIRELQTKLLHLDSKQKEVLMGTVTRNTGGYIFFLAQEKDS